LFLVGLLLQLEEEHDNADGDDSDETAEDDEDVTPMQTTLRHLATKN
jgi:hypothetical protein